MPQFPTCGSLLLHFAADRGAWRRFQLSQGDGRLRTAFSAALQTGARFKDQDSGLIAPYNQGFNIDLAVPTCLKSAASTATPTSAATPISPSAAITGQKFSDGLTMFASTVEVRYPILDQQLISSGVFGDFGNTWPGLILCKYCGRLFKGIGFGLRLNIPMMGLMGFDFGWPLDQNPKAKYSVINPAACSCISS
jgi:hypothetical protein